MRRTIDCVGHHHQLMPATPLLVLLLLLLGGGVGGEVYTSTAQLEQVLRVEREVVAILHDYIQHTQLKLDRMQHYVDDYNRLISDANDGEVLSADNPLEAYQLVKRLAVDWVALDSDMKNYDWSTVLSVIKEKRSEAVMPQEVDLQGAAFALIRLKHTYRLNVSDLMRGVLQGIHTRAQLSARDCLYLGRNTLHLQMESQAASLGQAIEWLEAAMTVANQEGNRTAGQEEIRPFLQEAIQMYDRAFPIRRNEGSFGIEDISVAKTGPPMAPALTPLRGGLSSSPYDDAANFDALCRGERLRPAAYEATLKCYYRTGPHAYLKLNRLKVEENHLHPPLLTLHDVIYDSEIQLIKTLAKPMLQRSTVVGPKGIWRQVSDTRTSQNTWLYDHVIQQHPLLLKLQRRINVITGLNTVKETEAEALQVANYGVGGHYVPHYDYLFQNKRSDEMEGVDPNDLAMGDRVATLMFYLSDVSRGGATAFPKMGAAIWPRKGSAAFWFNLKLNGEGDQMTLHGACPVLHGSKWVGNKWIRERSQMNTRRCSLDRNR